MAIPALDQRSGREKSPEKRTEPDTAGYGTIRFRIGPIRLAVTWTGMRPEPWPHPFYVPFLEESHVADIRLTLSSGLPTLPVQDLLFEAKENRWSLYRTDCGYLLETHDTKTGAINRRAVFDQQWSTGEVYLRTRRRNGHSLPTWDPAIVLRHLGELVLVNALARGRGLLVHALAVSDQGRGLLFVGHSGAGKSTLANLYKGRPGVTILGDERILLSRDGPGFLVSGTPWSGGAMTVSHTTVPLHRIFFLEHASGNVVHTDPTGTLAPILIQQLFLPYWDANGMACVLQLVDDLLQGVPAARLGFVNDDRIVDFLRDQLAQRTDSRSVTEDPPHPT